MPSSQDERTNAKNTFSVVAIILSVATALFALAAGWHKTSGWMLAVATFVASFLAGSLIGFIFSLVGSEQDAESGFAKIRDALIALISAAVGVSLAELAPVTKALGDIPVMVDPIANSRFVPLAVAIYIGFGFYFMYFFRKLILNSGLVEAENEINRLATSAADFVAKLSLNLPERFLLNHDYAEKISESDLSPDVREDLRTELWSSSVQSFLDLCDKNSEASIPLGFSMLTKVVALYYYRSYFEPDTKKQANLRKTALLWLDRALQVDPLDSLLRIRKADLLFLEGRYSAGAEILEQLVKDIEAPQYVTQWLGLFLLFVSGRIEDGINRSLEFFARFPANASAPYNAARGYSALYEAERIRNDNAPIPSSVNRKESLRYLKESIILDSSSRSWATDEASSDPEIHYTDRQWFHALHDDDEFIQLTRNPGD